MYGKGRKEKGKGRKYDQGRFDVVVNKGGYVFANTVVDAIACRDSQ